MLWRVNPTPCITAITFWSVFSMSAAYRIPFKMLWHWWTFVQIRITVKFTHYFPSQPKASMASVVTLVPRCSLSISPIGRFGSLPAKIRFILRSYSTVPTAVPRLRQCRVRWKLYGTFTVHLASNVLPAMLVHVSFLPMLHASDVHHAI